MPIFRSIRFPWFRRIQWMPTQSDFARIVSSHNSKERGDMEFLFDLWLPILVGTFVLWILSFVAWAVLPHHFGDRSKIDNEEGLMEYIREVPPGNYFFPYCGSSKEQTDKAYMERYTAGPRGTLNIYNMPNMPSNMIRTILYFFVTIFTIAYITHVACPPGDAATTFMKVFRVAGTIAVLNYASSGVLSRIWFTERMWTNIVDGIVYGITLGLIFAFFWPAGTA